MNKITKKNPCKGNSLIHFPFTIYIIDGQITVSSCVTYTTH